MKIIAVIGSKKSGKTTTVEAIVKGLTARGHRVATAKHISEKRFSLDTAGKDTWRHAIAGANPVVLVAQGELGIIKKIDTTKFDLREITQYCRNNVDFIIFEGFRSLMKNAPKLPKILSIKAYSEAVETLKQFKSIIALTGPAASTATKLGIPVVDILEEPEKLVGIIEKKSGI